MKINFIVPFIGHSGGIKVIFTYADKFIEKGHEVRIIYPIKFPFPTKNIRGKAYNTAFSLHNLLFKNKKLRFKTKAKLIRVPTLDNKHIPKADVVIATAWITAEWVNKYTADKGDKYYFIQHFEVWDGFKERVEATWKMPLKKIVIAGWLAEKAKELGQEVVACVPNGLDFNKFRLLGPLDQPRSKRMGMMYHKHDWKGSRDGIKALAMVKKKHPDSQAVFFSFFPQDKDIPDWIEFHRNPSPDKLLEIYNSCQIFICTSWHEGFFLPGAEAMACGCAFVSTDCQGINEYAHHEENALISPPKNPEALANNILRLLENKELLDQIRINGYNSIQEFTWENATEKFLKVICNE